MAWYWVALILFGALAAGVGVAFLWFGLLLMRAYNRGEF